MTACELQEKACAAFDEWLASLPDEHPVHDMDLIDQINAYAEAT